MKKRIIYLGVCLILSGCASPPPAPAPVAETPAKEVPKKVVEAPPQESPREQGSLWSDSSRWNEFYSSNATRNVGDVIFLKPSENLRSLIAGKNEKVVNQAGDTILSTGHDAGLFLVTIREVLPQGVYNVHGEQRVKVRGKEQQIVMQGKIRERDIAADDTTSSEYVFDMNLEVHGQDNEGPAKEASSQKDGTNPKEKTKEPVDSDADKNAKVSTAAK